MTDARLFNVVAVNIDTGAERFLAENVRGKDNAEAIVAMAVMRRGVDEEFYKVVPVETVSQ